MKKFIAKLLKIEPVTVFKDRITERVEMKEVIREKIRPAPKVNWTPEHAKGLNDFLKSPIGRDMISLMNQNQVNANAYACSSLNGTTETREFRAGVAYGINIGFNHVMKLSDILEENKSLEPTDEELNEIINNRLR